MLAGGEVCRQTLFFGFYFVTIYWVAQCIQQGDQLSHKSPGRPSRWPIPHPSEVSKSATMRVFLYRIEEAFFNRLFDRTISPSGSSLLFDRQQLFRKMSL
jgi:hypothetical protein